MTAPLFRPEDAGVLARLRAADPVGRTGVPEPGFDVAAFVDRLVAPTAQPAGDLVGAAARLRRPRRRWRPALVAIVGVVAVGGAATAGILVARSPDRPEAVGTCRVAVATDASALVLLGDDPIGECRDAWVSGAMVEIGGSAVQPAELTACVAPGGALDVYPGPAESCARLGLAPAVLEGPDAANLLVRQLSAATVGKCESVEDTAVLAHRLIGEYGMQGWSVRSQPAASTGDVCARVAVDSSTREVVLVPGPPP